MDNEEKIFELMTKMYSEMQKGFKEVYGEFDKVYSEMHKGFDDIYSEMHKGFEELGNRLSHIEIDHGQKLGALFDGYKLNSEKLDRIEAEVSRHEELIFKRIK